MWSKLFWKDLGERVIATIAETLLGVITINGFDLLNFDVVGTLSLVGVMTLGVVLKAIVAVARKNTVSPASLVRDDGGF